MGERDPSSVVLLARHLLPQGEKETLEAISIEPGQATSKKKPPRSPAGAFRHQQWLRVIHRPIYGSQTRSVRQSA